MIPLISLTGHRFNGRWITDGEAFEAKPIEAASLTYRKVAKFAPKGYQVRAMTPDPEPEQTHVTHEDAGRGCTCPYGSCAVHDKFHQPSPEPSQEHVEAPRRRRYRRRDMTAESTPE